MNVILIFSVSCLTMLPTTHTIPYIRLKNNELERIWKEVVAAQCKSA
jgi:hypothetical protein